MTDTFVLPDDLEPDWKPPRPKRESTPKRKRLPKNPKRAKGQPESHWQDLPLNDRWTDNDKLLAGASEPKPGTRPARTLSDSDIALIKKMTYPTTISKKRFMAVFVLMLETGLRIGEVAHLRSGSIVDRGDGLLHVMVPHEKGCKTGGRVVPVMRASLEPYLSMWIECRPRSNYLFGTIYNTMLGSECFNRAFRNYAAKAGVLVRVHAHMLRHTFATRKLADGWDLRSVQAALGHKQVNMTLRYLHASTGRLEDLVKGSVPPPPSWDI